MKRSLVFLPFLLLAGITHAQDSFDAHVADVGLLDARLPQAKQIQADIKVSEGERAKMNVAASVFRSQVATYQKQLQTLGQTNPDPVKERALFDGFKKQVISVLTPAHVRRLREITLQRLGLISLTDDQVAKRVGLSAAQVGRLKSAFQAGRTKFLALQQKAQQAAMPVVAQYKDRKAKNQAEADALRREVAGKLGPVRARFLPQFQAIGKATDVDMLAVLTPAQKSTWAALKGKPIAAK